MKRTIGQALLVTFLFAGIGSTMALADWTTFDLHNLSGAYGGTSLAHLPDGRYVFGETGNMYRQDTWSNAAYSAYSGEPSGIDPSFISIWDATHGAIGKGGWGAGELYTFNPGSLSSPGFDAIGNPDVTVQNYHGLYRDSNGLYIGGADTGPSTNHHGIRYVSLDGTTNTVIIDDISTYSCGFTKDADGNLYVGDNDDGIVYKFTASQLSTAIGGSALSITNGTAIHDFGGGGDIGTLAVDNRGYLWASGWQHNGLLAYNPDADIEVTYMPYLTNTNYKVTSFMRSGTCYIGFLNQANPGSDNSAQYYGFDEAGNYSVPEPSSLALMLTALAGLGIYRARLKHLS